MSDQIVHTSEAQFETDVIRAEVPVLVDFWAEWCGPCRAVAPILDALASEYAGLMRVVKLNVDESPLVAHKYNVRSIPTLLLFKGGAVAAQQVGAASKGQLQAFLNPHLSAAKRNTA